MPNRMRLGWMARARSSGSTSAVNSSSRNVVLHAAEALARTGPPAGRAAGIEIRVRDGWNYYFEYRCKQPTQKGDQDLDKISPAAQLVVGTDVIVLGNTGMMAGARRETFDVRVFCCSPPTLTATVRSSTCLAKITRKPTSRIRTRRTISGSASTASMPPIRTRCVCASVSRLAAGQSADTSGSRSGELEES